MLCMVSVSKISTQVTAQASWQNELANAFRKPEDLIDYLGLEIEDLDAYSKAHQLFPTLVTQHFAEQINKADINDPLLRQVLPLPDELVITEGYSQDPVGDMAASVTPGLIHKYHSRALVIATGACAIHCRYCFRRSFPYSENSTQRSSLHEAIDYLKANDNINEVILSGGDPLTLSDKRLGEFIDEAAAISHIKKLRIHSRLPVVLPSRITDNLLSLLQKTSLKVIMVIHANHANEFSNDVAQALDGLQQAGVTLLNQTVLLNGVNDDVNSLVDLSNTLFKNQVLPYYLHVLDKVSGAAHFNTPLNKTFALYTEIQKQLPGYLVPKLVKEEQGKPNKTLLYI